MLGIFKHVNAWFFFFKKSFDFNPFLKGMYFELLYDAMLLKKVVQ